MGTLKLLMADDKENKTVPEQEQGQSGWLTTRKLELAFLCIYIICSMRADGRNVHDPVSSLNSTTKIQLPNGRSIRS